MACATGQAGSWSGCRPIRAGSSFGRELSAGKTLGCGLSPFSEQARQFAALLWAEGSGGLFQVQAVAAEGALDEAAPVWSQLDQSRAMIGRVRGAAHEPPGLKPVDGGGDRAAGEQNLFPDGVYRLWPLVQQQLECSELREAEPESGNAALGVLLDRALSLPENEPGVQAAEVFLRLSSGSGVQRCGLGRGMVCGPGSGFLHGSVCHFFTESFGRAAHLS